MEDVRPAEPGKRHWGLRLDIRERLELFLPVCAAVDYAHYHWFGEYCCVVHLDIKPGNILIESPIVTLGSGILRQCVAAKQQSDDGDHICRVRG
jgi:serine/threonine protein kinase